MYFPLLYGRRSEFLALRAMLEDHRSLSALVPVIEPVKRGISDLTRCIEHFSKVDQPLAVILNPDKFELKASDEVKAWRKDIMKLIDEHECILPTYRCVSTTTMSQINAFLKRFEGREVALAYLTSSLSDTDIAALATRPNVRFHIVLNGRMATSQQALLPHTKRVDIRDNFNKLERNSDYYGVELFTDRHTTHKPSWIGFGDYATIGAAFTSGGGQPAAVAIHATFKHKSGNIWIEHFVSDDTDKDIGSTENKFVQAASKFVRAAKLRSKEFGTNFAIDKYAEHVKADHFPGLGTNKVLQISHHICLMIDMLNGDI